MTDIEDLAKLAKLANLPNLRPKKEYEIKDENYDKYVSIVKDLWKITYDDNKQELIMDNDEGLLVWVNEDLKLDFF